MKLSPEKVVRCWEMNGYTQRVASKEAGLNPSTLTRIRRGENVTPTTARKLAAALGVPVADLVREPDE